ncbi:MAG: hypothetical protein JSR36_16025 [Proteobacteria bacterium]|nr:hypothetical protein [Pseudomonadota bacterium]
MTLTSEAARDRTARTPSRPRRSAARAPERSFPRYALGLALALLVGCSARHEVARLPSPDGALDAVLIESSSHAATAADYTVYVVKRRAPLGRYPAVMYIRAVPRGDDPVPVAPKWTAPDTLAVEYLSAKEVTVPHAEMHLENRTVRIAPRPGVLNASATPGGMP